MLGFCGLERLFPAHHIAGFPAFGSAPNSPFRDRIFLSTRLLGLVCQCSPPHVAQTHFLGIDLAGVSSPFDRYAEMFIALPKMLLNAAVPLVVQPRGE
jgi:hypothetical protein